jgi:predicted phage-related endonuclease
MDRRKPYIICTPTRNLESADMAEDIIEPASEVTTLTPEQLEQRMQVIGGSEVASLFGLGYKTKLELWLEKAGEIEPAAPSSEAIERGTFMEPSIAAWAAHRTGYRLQKVSEHLVHPEVDGWGCNLDYRVLDDERGPAPCEIKSVHYFQGKRAWMLEGDMEAPPHIELQLHHQMGAMQAAWGLIAADVGGSLVLIEREWNQHFQDRIQEEIEDFWDSIRQGTPPDPDLEKDLKTLQRLYPDHTPNRIVPLDDDLRHHLHDLELGRQYKSAGEALEKAAKTAIWWKIGAAEAIDLGDWEGDGTHKVLMAKTTNRAGYTVEPTKSRTLQIKKAPKDFGKDISKGSQ